MEKKRNPRFQEPLTLQMRNCEENMEFTESGEEGVERVTYASRPWGCEGLWVEKADAVAKALVLHSGEGFAHTDSCAVVTGCFRCDSISKQFKPLWT